MTATWTDRLRRPREERRSVLTSPFAGIAPGSVLYVSTPQRLDQEVRTVPPGRTVTVAELRRRLADVTDADATCPVTTAMFLRIVAEAALDEHASGTPLDQVTPFWRVVDPDSDLARRLSCGPALVASLRQREAGGTPPAVGGDPCAPPSARPWSARTGDRAGAPSSSVTSAVRQGGEP